MKLRRTTGALLVAAALAACEGSALEPPIASGPLLERQDIPPGLEENPYIPFDTSNIHTGYFGSGHNEPPPPTDTILIPG
jgi:hypothetical protein